jgi:pyruvate dehydrogenase E2 component (dihydrolipoamide acetyltransferase)
MWKIGMPNLGHTMEEGTVREWLKKEGDPVRKGDVLVVVESDKASFDVESPGDGVLLKVVVAEGGVVPVGAPIGVVGAPGSLLPDLGPAAAPVSRAQPAAGPAPAAAPAARPAAAGRVQVSPVARTLAQEMGVDLAAMTGSGPGGLITRDDVRRAAESKGSAGPDAEDIVVVPLSPMRRTIAERMQRSWRDAPMVTLVAQADVAALLARREAEGGRVSINDLILRGTAIALTGHPRLNGWWIKDQLQQVRDVNLGVAVAVEDGLVVPVVRAAQRKTVAEIAAEVAALSGKARAGRLATADVADGTFSVSNLGAWGIDLFTPIINPPQVAILGIGRVSRVPRETATGVAFTSAVALCLVFDHRAVDGATGAAMLQTLVQVLGDPARIFGPAGQAPGDRA